jgi:hypothetical protein
MMRIFLILTFILTWVVSCAQEPRNVIRGEVEGLEVGDKITLLVQDLNGVTWIATDSTVVDKAGEFALETGITGNLAALRLSKTGAAFEPVVKFFLEGYAGLRVTGRMEDWESVKISGGLYAHPDMQEIVSIEDNMWVIEQTSLALIARLTVTRDALLVDEFEELQARSEVLSRDLPLLKTRFREQHPEMAYSAFLLREDRVLMIENLDEYEATFNALAPAARESPAGRSAYSQIARLRATGVGSVAPDFTCEDMNGRKITLSSFRGKHVVLDFWGSGLRSYRTHLHPMLVKLYDDARAKSAGIEFISIACREPDDETWREAVKADKLTWTQLNDNHAGESGSIEKLYAVRELPAIVLISPDGIILEANFSISLSKIFLLLER